MLQACSMTTDIAFKLPTGAGPHVKEATEFHDLGDTMHDLTYTRHENPMQFSRCVSICTTSPEQNLVVSKCMLHYLQGTKELGLLLLSFSSLELIVYSNTN